ncbi:MAG: hypothetical protein ACKPAC_11645 [Alphaproteobacteria bacterium]
MSGVEVVSKQPLDLSEQEEPSAVAKFGAAPYDPAQDREKVRGWIASALIILLIGLISLLFVAILFRMVRVDDLDKIVATVLTPIMGIVGTVIGFYFGEKSK